MQAKSCIEKMALAQQNGSDGRLKGTVHRVVAVHCTIRIDSIANIDDVRLNCDGQITVISTNNGISLLFIIIVMTLIITLACLH